MTFIRTNVALSNKRSLKEIAHVINVETQQLPSHFKNLQWYIAVNDAITSRLSRPVQPKPKRKPPKNICHIHYSCKTVKQEHVK